MVISASESYQRPPRSRGDVRAAPRRQQADAVGRDRLEFPRHSAVTGVAWTLRSHRKVTAGELRRRSTFATKGRLANMSMTKLRWGRVEYQLDLRTPQRPVPLGVVEIADEGHEIRDEVDRR